MTKSISLPNLALTLDDYDATITRTSNLSINSLDLILSQDSLNWSLDNLKPRTLKVNQDFGCNQFVGVLKYGEIRTNTM